MKQLTIKHKHEHEHEKLYVLNTKRRGLAPEETEKGCNLWMCKRGECFDVWMYQHVDGLVVTPRRLVCSDGLFFHFWRRGYHKVKTHYKSPDPKDTLPRASKIDVLSDIYFWERYSYLAQNKNRVDVCHQRIIVQSGSALWLLANPKSAPEQISRCRFHLVRYVVNVSLDWHYFDIIINHNKMIVWHHWHSFISS